MGCGFEHKARVLSEPFYISFISHVDEDWSIFMSPTPERVIDEIPLLKGLVALGIEIEVVKYLGEILLFVELIFGSVGELLRTNDRRRKSRCNFGN